MNEIGTQKGILRRSTDRPIFARIAPPADFVSQGLIQRLAQRSAPEAAGAYAASARAALRRMPPGYRTTRIA